MSVREMTVGERIKLEREARGLGRRPMKGIIRKTLPNGKTAGAAATTIEAWEEGMRVPGLEWAESIAELLNEPVERVREQLMREHGWLQENERLVIVPEPSTPVTTKTKKGKTTGKLQNLASVNRLSPNISGVAA